MWYPVAGTTVPYLRNCGTRLLEQWCNSGRNLHSHVPTPEIVKLELPEPQESVGGITITRNDTVITIPSDSSTEHIRIIMEALMHA